MGQRQTSSFLPISYISQYGLPRFPSFLSNITFAIILPEVESTKASKFRNFQEKLTLCKQPTKNIADCPLATSPTNFPRWPYRWANSFRINYTIVNPHLKIENTVSTLINSYRFIGEVFLKKNNRLLFLHDVPTPSKLTKNWNKNPIFVFDSKLQDMTSK